jgi:nitrogen fixation protein NifX
MSETMTREAALRIALAAREMPGVEARALVQGLAAKLHLPLTETKLATFTVEDLRCLLAGDHADQNCHVGVDGETLKAVVRLLWGIGVTGSELPPVESYADGELPGSIRVACASNSGENLDGHFGSCERFLVYQVSPDALRLIGVRPTLGADQAEDRNVARAAIINDCHVVYVQSIGGPAAAKVVRAGVHPVKIPGGAPARETLVRLQATLNRPPPWLAKIMGVTAGSLTRFVDAAEAADAAESAEASEA